MPYKDRERYLEYKRLWRERNKDKIREYARKYNESPLGKKRAKEYASKYNEKVRNSEASVAARIKWNAQLLEWASTKEERNRAKVKKETARRSRKRKLNRELAALNGNPMRPLLLTEDQRKEARRIARRNYKDRKRKAEGRMSNGIVDRLLKLQKSKCPVCKELLVLDGDMKFHIDHIVPLAKGGSNHDENIQLLCRDCNQEKNAIDPVEFMQLKGFLI